MGYEVAEQFGWTLPDAIFYPTGGGVGMIGMWKAFAELEALGWISSQAAENDRRAGGQAASRWCGRSSEGEFDSTEFWENAHTVAAGLARPETAGRRSVARRDSRERRHCHRRERRGTAGRAASSSPRKPAFSPRPKAAPAWPALKQLLANGFLKPDERIVLYNTGTGLKYLEAFSTRFPRTSRSEQDKLGRLDYAPITAH